MEGLFVHIHKAAGNTVKRVLFRQLKLKNVRTLFGVHMGRKIWRSCRREDISDEAFAAAFKFCFVRNPWDRVVSAYAHARQRWGTEFDVTFEDFICTILLDERICWDSPWLHDNPDVSQREKIWWYSKSNAIPYTHPGYFMASMNFIGRFENFEADFRRVLSRLQCTQAVIIPIRNASARAPYPGYYTPRLRAAVGDLYHEDIVKFNYTFAGK